MPARVSDRRILAGIVALGAIALLLGGAFAGLLVEAGRNWSGAVAAFDSYLLRVARFTLWQAALSTLLSVGPALFVARALYRQTAMPGRGFVLGLFAVPLALPAIVAALGILALYGRAGYFAGVMSWIGGEPWAGIYGLQGILVAHVFFNLPLATRLFVEALEATPADHTRLAAQLGMGARASFRHIEWPALRAALPGVAALVFMLCITSFTIVLTLGGGPRATTLEVAIYQALRFDFDPARAVMLTVAQVALTVIVVVAIARLGASLTGEANLALSARRYIARGRTENGLNIAFILIALAFVAGPMIATLLAGIEADLARLVSEATVQRAALTSLVFAMLSALLATALSLALVTARRALEQLRSGREPGLLEWLTGNGAALVLVVPPIVIGAGWFILLRHVTRPLAAAPFIVVTVNAVMAMPFVMRALRAAHDAAAARHDRLAASLGITGWNRLRLIDLPPLRRPLATGFAFAMALSLGDLGVIALFGSENVQTLPYLLLSRMSAYRTQDAAGLALILAVMCLALMFLTDRLGKSRV